MNLIAKHERFCEEYLLDLNATQAYLRVGYKVSPELASKNSFKLLQKPEIQKRIQELMKERSERTAITADRVLRELARIAFFNIAQAFEISADGELMLKNLKELPEDVTAAISEVSQFQSFRKTRTSIKAHNKVQALIQLMQHLGLNSDFNTAMNTLRKYGLELCRNQHGKWEVQDLSRSDA